MSSYRNPELWDIINIVLNLNTIFHIYTIFEMSAICNEFNIVCSSSNMAHIHINSLFT